MPANATQVVTRIVKRDYIPWGAVARAASDDQSDATGGPSRGIDEMEFAIFMNFGESLDDPPMTVVMRS